MLSGTLYGTPEAGGTNCRPRILPGCGPMFALDPNTGVETGALFILQSAGFHGWLNPNASLIDVKGALYGTTSWGGANCATNNPPGCGIAFALDPNTGVETVLYSFSSLQNGTDGNESFASLIGGNHKLYRHDLVGWRPFRRRGVCDQEP